MTGVRMLLSCLRLCLIAAAFIAVCGNANALEVEIRFDKQLSTEPYSGRVYVFFSQASGEPRTGPNWFRPEPILSLDVTDWQPDTPLVVSTADPHVRKFPRNFDRAALAQMRAQAVIRFNPHDRNVGTGIGNGYSDTKVVGTQPRMVLRVQQLVSETPPRLAQRVKLVSVESALLSDFHRRPVQLKASIVLPQGYDEHPSQRYPVIYEIPGFGGTHLYGLDRLLQPATNSRQVEFIRVMLDPSTARGHHVFANSANNGPYRDALVQELIPAIDRQFRTDAREYGRFLTGHSSGGWSSLWVQIDSPSFFGGVWSTAPDPVDFRDFQRINIYNPEDNMFVDAEGRRRPLARMNGRVILWYDDFNLMEDVLGYGGQLHSFEAVFSPRDADGTPQPLWDRDTGEIDNAVAAAWKAYDINLVLRSRWPQLEPQLRGKLHVIMGDADTFYLEGATVLLKQTLAELGSDADIQILPGRNHFNLFQGGLGRKIEQEIAEQFVAHRNE